MEKLLISGITGFVGSNLKPYLQPEYKIVGVSRKGDCNNNVLSYTALARHDWNDSKAFIHLAGKAHDLKKSSSDEEYFKVNTELTKKIFKQFLQSECRIFIYISSVKAVKDTVEAVLDEKTSPNPLTAYGKSKLAAENYLLNSHLPPDKRVYIFRPGMIHGPHNKGNLNLLYQVIKRGIPYPLGSFENKRSFVYVENFCFIIKNFLIKEPPSGIYNLADNDPLSTSELVRIIGETAGKKARILKVPRRFIRKMAKAGDRLNLPFTTERLEKLTENYIISNTKCLDAIGCSLPFNTRSGIKKTIQSFNP